MQLTAPLFLFLFLPASLALFFLTPRRGRTLTLTLLSGCWLLLANFGNWWGLLHVALTVLFAILFSRHAAKRQLLPPLGAALLFLSLIASRVLTLCVPHYSYPTGLLFITLSAISLLFDKARGDAGARDSTLEELCYLLFFPTATLGPAVRYKHFLPHLRKSAPSTARFCAGIRLFMLGYIKRMALAAVLYRALNTVLGEAAEMPFIALPAALLFSFLLFYFFVSGTADMARGVAAMYGMRLPRDRADLLRTTSPHTMFYALFFSVHCHLQDYLFRPLARRFPSARGNAAAALLSLFLFLLLFSPVPTAWVVALPLACTALCAAVSKPAPRRRHPAARALLFLLSSLSCSLLSLVVAAGDPRRVTALIRAVCDGEAARSYTFYFVVPDLQYILLAVAALAVLTLLIQLYRRHSNRLGERACFRISLLTTALLFAGFLLTLLYFMPQFPQYALSPFGA